MARGTKITHSVRERTRIEMSLGAGLRDKNAIMRRGIRAGLLMAQEITCNAPEVFSFGQVREAIDLLLAGGEFEIEEK